MSEESSRQVALRILWIAIKLAIVVQLGTAAAARFAYEGF